MKNLKIGKKVTALVLSGASAFVIGKAVHDYKMPIEYDFETILNAFSKESITSIISQDESLISMVDALENSLYVSETVNDLKLSPENIDGISVKKIEKFDREQFDEIYNKYQELKKDVKKHDGITNDAVKLYKYEHMLTQYARMSNLYLVDGGNKTLNALISSVLSGYAQESTGCDSIEIDENNTLTLGFEGSESRYYGLRLSSQFKDLMDIYRVSSSYTYLPSETGEYDSNRNKFLAKSLSKVKECFAADPYLKEKDESITMKLNKPLFPKNSIEEQVEAHQLIKSK